MTGAIRSVTLTSELTRALEAITPGNEDAAAVELAKLYARQIDQAASIRRAADRALREAVASGDEALVEQVTALRAKLSERECLAQIGARFVALLVELQATPKARGKKADSVAGLSKLAQLRGAS